MDMDKNSFLMYLDYEEQFDLLTDEQIGQLMRAIMKYEKTGKIPELEGMLKMAFAFIKTQLDRDREKWHEEKQKRSRAGKKGMSNRWKSNSDNNVITEDNKNNSVINDIKNITNITDNVDVDVNVDVDDDVDVNSNVIIKQQLQQRFIECIGSTNLNAINECISYLKDLPYEVIEKALLKTSGSSNPNWNYAKTILNDWVTRKINTIEKVSAEEEKFKKSRDGPKVAKSAMSTMGNFKQREYKNLDDFYKK